MVVVPVNAIAPPVWWCFCLFRRGSRARARARAHFRASARGFKRRGKQIQASRRFCEQPRRLWRARTSKQTSNRAQLSAARPLANRIRSRKRATQFAIDNQKQSRRFRVVLKLINVRTNNGASARAAEFEPSGARATKFASARASQISGRRARAYAANARRVFECISSASARAPQRKRKNARFLQWNL